MAASKEDDMDVEEMDVEEKLLYAARNGDSKTVGVLLDKNHQGNIILNINCKGNLLWNIKESFFPQLNKFISGPTHSSSLR